MSNQIQTRAASAYELLQQEAVSSARASRPSRSMAELKRYRSEMRRSHMSPEHRANLERLSIAVSRYSARNERIALCHLFGFRRIEKGEVPQSEIDAALDRIRHQELVRMQQAKEQQS